ncbi:MAG: FaeA/PapI family transcriptional regulator [Nannocystaceae bacterium]
MFRAENGELERLSALETLKGLKSRETVTVGDLVRFLESRGLWANFAKITLADLRDAFAPPPPEPPAEPAEGGRRRKKRILEEELGEVEAEAKARPKEPEDGGLSTEEVGRQVLPFIEGNGEVTFDDIADYAGIDRKVLRYHLGQLVKAGRLERIGLGRTAMYSTL